MGVERVGKEVGDIFKFKFVYQLMIYIWKVVFINIFLLKFHNLTMASKIIYLVDKYLDHPWYIHQKKDTCHMVVTAERVSHPNYNPLTFHNVGRIMHLKVRPEGFIDATCNHPENQ